MTVIVLLAALAIDVSTWFVKHHQAQVTADAAALAAANYMSGGGSAGTATTTATTYASDNSLPISSSNVKVDMSNDTVTVTVPTTGPRLFAGIALGSGPSISARAVASWLLKDCASAGSGCAFIYAGDNVCSGNTAVQGYVKNKIDTIGHGVTVAKAGTGSGVTITGDLISASNLTTKVDGNPTFNSAAVYSNGSGCTSTGASVSSPSPYNAIYQRAVTSKYPVDYRTIYSACGTTSTKFGPVTCDSNGYPNYCTAADEGVSAVTTIDANAVYCNAGSGTKSDPAMWNGTTTVSSGGNGTFIAGTVNINLPSNSTLGPASGNALLAYGAECNASTPLPTFCPSTGATTTNPAVNFTSSGNAIVTGDVFAPAGVIDSNLSGTPNLTGFLEGWDVVYNANGTVTAQGPPVTNDVYFIGDSLIQ